MFLLCTYALVSIACVAWTAGTSVGSDFVQAKRIWITVRYAIGAFILVQTSEIVISIFCVLISVGRSKTVTIFEISVSYIRD